MSSKWEAEARLEDVEDRFCTHCGKKMNKTLKSIANFNSKTGQKEFYYYVFYSCSAYKKFLFHDISHDSYEKAYNAVKKI